MKAFAEVDERNDADFGLNASDWKTYIEWGKEKPRTQEEIEMAGLDALLEKYWHLIGSHAQHSFTPTDDNQIQMTVGLFRTPEIIFQPCLVGSDQMGLPEVLQYLLARFDPQVSGKLLKHIFLTGGNMAFTGMKERVVKELTEISPMGQPISVDVAEDVILDAWRGAAAFANGNDQNENAWFSIDQYSECGVDYLLQKNRYFSSNLG
jgi:actin-related protein 5